MPLLVKTSSQAVCEKKYIFSVILTEFLGLEFEVEEWEKGHTRTTDVDGRFLDFPDVFFTQSDLAWLNESTLPQPLGTWNTTMSSLNFAVVDPRVKIVYGADPGNPEFFVATDRFVKVSVIRLALQCETFLSGCER